MAETNLFNAKLLYSNKLLQNESLTSKQKAQVVARIDEAKSEREVKLVYESVAKKLSEARNINESAGRQVLGSASRVTRSAGAQPINEGIEAGRWAKLAGITK